ncbi:MAG: AMP-binding protein [Methyloligellaceae bacterium]
MRDIGGWETRLDDNMIETFSNSGDWSNRTIVHFLDKWVKTRPDQVLITDNRQSLTCRELRDKSAKLAASLRNIGLKQGDVISLQLPNWWEAAVIDMAAAMGGFVVNPIVPIYRESEVLYILRNSGSRMYIAPDHFGNFDYVPFKKNIQKELPDLAGIVTVRGENDNPDSFNSLIDGQSTNEIGFVVDPNAVKLLMYTSGTSGRPKGVLHSHNTLASEIQNVIKYWKLDQSDRILMPAPITHIGGYLYGIQLPITLGIEAVLMERWDAAEGLELVENQNLTMTVGATPFLQEIVELAEKKKRNLPSLRYFGCGGAPVPPDLIHRTHKTLTNCLASRIYGSTEAPTVTLGVTSRTQGDLAANTEGFIVGHEVKLVNDDGEPVGVNSEGEILTRGPENFIGYADFADNKSSFETDGYFRTGDLAVQTQEGCLTITGRKKDIIIRGGENISPKEIEDILHSHPSIQEVAIVAMPHKRMGETCCAYVKVNQGCKINLDQIIDYLESHNIAKQKFPERLEPIDEFPRTASGKIRKNVLRRAIAKLVTEHTS